MTEPGFVLALETSQRSQSIAIRLHDGVVHEEVVHAEDRAQEDLLPAVARTVERSGCTPEQLRGVILNAGPGGFTGLRLAHAAAQSIAVALRVPVVQVSGATCARAAAILAGELAPSPRVPIRPDDPLAPIWGLGHRGLAEGDGETAAAPESRSSGGDA